ncbi:MAG: ATP-binding protein [Betaproteobacteria bacterium]|jgi:signal transduction histidine kinase
MSFSEIAALTLHDIKNRLAQLASRAEARGDLETLREAMDSAAGLSRLLTYYRTDIGNLSLDIDAHSPSDLILELTADSRSMRPCAAEPDIREAPSIWFYDEALVRMVLVNALQNASRHARSRISLKACQRDAVLVFTVSDDGDGYPEKVLSDAEGNSPPVSREGTGLGIRLAKRIAEMHVNQNRKGAVSLENNLGAHFHLILP